ncbi:hypothetical protein ONS95_010560 [Cadophora gregata]|uniref:uncharacterized protein n=1 Tax=Cadophora gregata TaxID=51156 RepID=UPI0026DCECF0|nr:uncharacterized protein ONS95_010560 [Cadophora gregata]KAK0122318.1 hypothetical protein ONS95_010560 [Cadophora gregata]
MNLLKHTVTLITAFTLVLAAPHQQVDTVSTSELKTCRTDADCPNRLWKCSPSDKTCHFHLRELGEHEKEKRSAFPFYCDARQECPSPWLTCNKTWWICLPDFSMAMGVGMGREDRL